MRNLKTGAAILAVAALTAMPAKASLDTATFILDKANVSLTPPFGKVTVDLVSGTEATITLQALGTYSFGDGSTLGLNLAGLSFTGNGTHQHPYVSTPSLTSDITLTGRTGGGAPSVKNVNVAPGQTVDGWGTFNYTIDLNGGFGNSITKLVLDLTRDSGSWSKVSDMFAANGKGSFIVGHVMNFDGSITGFAVPEPTTMIAGALLLLPFGASTLRGLRKNRTA